MKNKNIVIAPTKEMNSYTIKFNVGLVPVELNFVANVSRDELQAVLDNWFARTAEHTSKSLVNYINSKSAFGFKALELKDVTIENTCTGRKITNPDYRFFTAFKNSILDGTWKIKE